jgi:hypothetical protein
VNDAQIELPGLADDLYGELDDIADDFRDGLTVSETAPVEPAPAPAPSPSRPMPAPTPQDPEGMVRFPLLDTPEAPCVLAGPFACVVDTDIPAILVYRPRAQLATRPGASGGTREFLGVVTHDADEQDIARHFGPGDYHLAVKGPTGFIRWGRLSIGTPRSAMGSSRVVLAQPPAPAGGAVSGLAPDEPPAWAKSLLSRLDALEHKGGPANGQMVDQVIAQAEATVRQVEALGALGERLRALSPRTAPADSSAETEDDEEPGVLDYTADALGNLVKNGVQLKGLLDEFKALGGS